MPYVTRRTRDSIPLAIPVLLATGSVALLALIWRRMAAPRSQRTLTRQTAHPADLPTVPESAGDDTQHVHAGTGELFHRRYEVQLAGTGLTAGEALRLMHRHMTELVPSPLAHFEKSAGAEGLLQVGDEYDITMLGPWNGKVRVTESTLDHFTLVTLDGHPEAGHITFRVVTDDDTADTIRVQIESWARARDAVVHAAYATLGIGKQIQTEVWITFLQRLSTLAGMHTTPEVQLTTEQLPQKGLSSPAGDTPADD